MPDITIISILKDTADKLKNIRLVDRESYDEIIQRLLKVAYKLEEARLYEREPYVEIIKRLLEVYNKHKKNET